MYCCDRCDVVDCIVLLCFTDTVISVVSHLLVRCAGYPQVTATTILSLHFRRMDGSGRAAKRVRTEEGGSTAEDEDCDVRLGTSLQQLMNGRR